MLGDGSTAVVEVARASGISLVDEVDRDAEAASSAGTGELIAAAARAGARKVLVAAGGSASTDGGAGAIEAIQEAGGLGGAKLEVICDTSLPFEGRPRSSRRRRARARRRSPGLPSGSPHGRGRCRAIPGAGR